MAYRPLLALALGLGVLTVPSHASSPDSIDPNAVHRQGDDLIAPLPQDMAARERAIAEQQAAAEARTLAIPGTRVVSRGARMQPVAPLGRFRLQGVHATRGASGDADALRARLDAAWERVRSEVATTPSLVAGTPAPEAQYVPAASLSLPIGQNQVGIDDTGLSPASPDIAVGLTRVMIVTTDVLQVRDRCGNLTFAGAFSALFPVVAGTTIYDPRVVYDEWDNRFVMTWHAYKSSAPATSHLFLCVSDDETALDWTVYQLQFGLVGNLVDDGAVVLSPDGIYMSGQEFDLVTFAFEGTTILEVDKADAYSGAPFIPVAHRNLQHASDASAAANARPAQMHSYPGVVYFLGARTATNNNMTLWTMTGAAGAGILTSASIPTAAYTTPPQIQQPGPNNVRTPDCRIADAVYADGKVTGVSTVRNNAAVTFTSVLATQVTVATSTSAAVAHGSPTWHGFHPSIDIDDNGRFGMCFASTSTVDFIGSRYLVFRISPLVVVESGIVVSGQAIYNPGAPPYRWGNWTGTARDPLDERTFWMHTAIASLNPADTWETRITLANASGFSALAVTALDGLQTGGDVGGIFDPDQLRFRLQNTGAGTLNWSITTMPAWAQTTALSGTIAPFTQQIVTLDVTSEASGLLPGHYPGSLVIDNCSGGGDFLADLSLTVRTGAECPSALLYLFPGGTFPSYASVPDTEPGVFITAIENIDICGVGIGLNSSTPGAVFAYVYAANGTTRGGMLASGSAYIYQTGFAFVQIPLSQSLTACQEYEIVVQTPSSWTYPAYNDGIIYLPYDSHQRIRIRDGSVGGDAGQPILAPMTILEAPRTCGDSDLVTTSNTSFGGAPVTRGVFIQPDAPRQLCAVGVTLDVPPGTRVKAEVWNTSGFVLQMYGATGNALVATSGLHTLEIPLSYPLQAGEEYLINVIIPTPSTVRLRTADTLPRIVDWFEVLAGSAGNAVHPDVPELALHTSPDIAGDHFDLAKPGAPPTNSPGGPGVRGVFITSEINQEVYSAGLYADIPAGTEIVAGVYEATGTTRGSSITYGSIVSVADGLRWHDVPVAASFKTGTNYDIEFDIANSTALPSWDDTSGLPYTAYGTVTVLDAESAGGPSTELLHYRLHACNLTATPVDGGPARAPLFRLSASPNPASNAVRFGYELDAQGPVEMAVYDVAGRLVERVFSTASAPRGAGEVAFDTSRIASGVYFVKLTTRSRTLSRKFVVTH